MSEPSTETQLALIHQQMEFFKEALARIESNQTTSSQDIQGLKTEVGRLKTQMSDNAPTIQEFVTIKHKVQGAGIFGKYLWAGGAALLTFILSNYEKFFHVFSGK